MKNIIKKMSVVKYSETDKVRYADTRAFEAETTSSIRDFKFSTIIHLKHNTHYAKGRPAYTLILTSLINNKVVKVDLYRDAYSNRFTGAINGKTIIVKLKRSVLSLFYFNYKVNVKNALKAV